MLIPKHLVKWLNLAAVAVAVLAHMEAEIACGMKPADGETSRLASRLKLALEAVL